MVFEFLTFETVIVRLPDESSRSFGTLSTLIPAQLAFRSEQPGLPVTSVGVTEAAEATDGSAKHAAMRRTPSPPKRLRANVAPPWEKMSCSNNVPELGELARLVSR